MSKIKIYTLSTCSHCRATKKFFDECKIGFDFIDVDLAQGKEREDLIEEVKKVNPRCSFPTILIGDLVIIGFKEEEIRKAIGI